MAQALDVSDDITIIRCALDALSEKLRMMQDDFGGYARVDQARIEQAAVLTHRVRFLEEALMQVDRAVPGMLDLRKLGIDNHEGNGELK